jgi:hypothetical protein
LKGTVPQKIFYFGLILLISFLKHFVLIYITGNGIHSVKKSENSSAKIFEFSQMKGILDLDKTTEGQNPVVLSL